MGRYDRQERVAKIGKKGQAKLRQATILIVGTGALGTYAAEQLTRAGIGKLILLDPDYVSLSNLQRQTLFDEEDVINHELKVFAAQKKLQATNHEVEIVAIPSPLSEEIIKENNFNLCLDCTDNYWARDLLNQLAIKYDFDYLFASCAATYGNVMAISSRQNPCLNCLFPDLTSLKQKDCELLGVATPLIPIISGIQVALAFKYLIAKQEVDFNQLITYDCFELSQHHFQVNKNKNCPSCSKKKSDLIDDQNQIRVLCGSQTYYVNLNAKIELNDWVSYFTKQQTLLTKSPMFIRFKWDKHPFTLFKNGKLIMYQIENMTEAQKNFQNFKKLATQLINKE